MNKYLNKEQRMELIARHKLERDKRVGVPYKDGFAFG